LKTAITRLIDPVGGIVAAILVCLVVAGSLLGNSFVAGRMTVAAAHKSWLPSPLGLVGQITSNSSSNSDAPLNALLLSTILSTLYILLGNFRALLTFNGLGEYSFFFLTAFGALVLRWREPELERPYRPWLAIPGIFVIVRGAIFAPVQAGILVGVWFLGGGFWFIRGRSEVSFIPC
jgi:L-type amino acid transporter 9